MSGSVNKVTLVGNLGRDPEIRAMQNGDKIVQLSIATSDRWKDKNSGEQRERTEWHRVVIFNDALGKIAEQYLKKGSTVYLEGQLQTRKWTDQQSGQDKYTTEVVLQRYRGELTLLGSRPDNQINNEYNKSEIDQSSELPVSNIASDLDDEIPF
ncbi:MAG: single-stranded DNA-binding protein [Candidatus Puniceispirillales bacterium]|jgi:single-strand DNA-binding protein|nr:single-stranded DNA-binding protein [SAR116 cluster bacterium]|tara:strand:+ start:935 stop:1396 length:462 start_codon:yes stop_codon:yes gene_type:complete